ncbi:TonB-dependent receptor [Terriglobus aquaticus]|uniref:Carboxypeptidase regulatory-like domain-containing protein n=1 Tax=Terriglobus aquaticus TaxID=940139 RepID=A0ABW9KH24_9BACT|nr:carboxypeptidase regulatory-like domain-containing protein [Terriglobus aquaticus]
MKTHCSKLRASVFVAALAVSAVTATGFAQTAALGNIAGVVRDAAGSVVPSATVTVINTGTGAKKDLTTDSDGHYTATFLQPGTYEVIISGSGFGRVDQKNVQVTVGNTNTVDATLPAGSVSSEVTVTTDAVLVDSDRTDQSQVVGERLVNNLPVNGRRFDNFVLLTPNVVPDGNSGLLSFRGISGLYNTNLVDGANNNQAFFSEARGRSIGAPYVFPIDAIQEFQSATSSYSAEFGQAAGGVINAITKSGTNSFHGDAYEYYRTPGFNALDPQNKYQGRTGNNPLLLQQPIKTQHQFGAAVGGPIIRDKMFFHAVYDGYRRRNPITYLSTYNTATQNISQLVALCDGRTSNYLTRGSAIFPSVIPNITAAQCSAAVNFINGTQLGSFQRNTKQDIFLPRLDFQATSKTHLSASFLFENLQIPNGYNSSTTVNNGGVSQNGTINFHERFLFANAETSLSSTATNVVHFQWSRDLETASTNSGGPAINITNLASYGETSALPRGAFPDEHRWQITDIYNTVRGKHNLKVGVDINLIHEQISNLFQGDGSFTYGTGSTEFNFANWIQDVYQVNGGRHYNSFTQVNDPITHVGADDFWNKDLDIFVQDDWKITPKLLLSMGARYDVQLVPQPERPNTSSPVAQTYTSTINIDYHMAAPRFGFAWTPHEGMVVRGGYGLFFALTSNSTFYANRRENGVFQQQFNVNAITNPNTPYVAAGTGCTPAVGTNRCFTQSGTYASYAPQGGIPAFTPPGPAPINQVTGAATPAVNPGLPPGTLGARGNDPNFLNPYTHSYDLSVEQQLPLRSTLSVGYVGTRGMRLPIFVDTNVDPTSAVVRNYTYINAQGVSQVIPTPYYTRRLYTTTGTMLTGFSDVNSWYNSLAVSLRKPLSRSFQVLANYTWAHAMDGGQVSGVNGTFNGTDVAFDPFARGHRAGRAAEYSRSDLDVRGRFVGSLVAISRFPIGNKLAAYAANGWQLTTTVTAQTGLPLTAFMSNSPVSVIGDGGLTGAELSLNNAGTPGRVPTAVAPRNAFKGPGVHNTDLRLSREFPLREGMRIEIAAEAFNIANHRNQLGVNQTFATYQTAGTSTTAGSGGAATTCPATATDGCIVPYTQTGFGAQTSTSGILYTPRQLQFLGRFFF